MTRLRAWSLRLGFALAVGYVALLAALFVWQRELLYPASAPREIRAKGDFEVRTVPYEGGTVPTIVHVVEGRPGVAWFHGNAQQLASTVAIGRALVSRGLSFGAVEYPGYGLSTGAGPSEAALLAAARAGLAEFAASGLDAPACVGNSLGTGVAAAMAREGRCGRLVLVSPYTSLPAVAQWQVPWVPALWLVRDQFDTLGGAAEVRVPTLVLHGTRDEVVPLDMGRRVAAAISGASFMERATGHNNILDAESFDAIAAFVR